MGEAALTRRDFIKQTGKAALSVSGALVLGNILDGCAGTSIIESAEDVAKIKWDANPAIPVPQNGCYIGWHHQLSVAPYYSFAIESEEKLLNEWHYEFFDQYPAVHSAFEKTPSGEDFPTYSCQGMYNKGVIPLLRYYFKPDWENVANGKYDKIIEKFALGAKKFGKPFFITPYPEANIDRAYKHVHPWAGGVGKHFGAAWRHMHNIFNEIGANEHAIWGLHLLGFGANQGFDNFDIEDQYVDWVGFSIYNFDRKYIYRSLAERFNFAYYWASKNHPTKPIALWELGSSDTSSQGKWMKNAYETIKNKPRIKLVVWAEYDFWTDYGKNDSTRFTEEGREAYKEATSDPYFIGASITKS